jgi:lauroyl/myristoyl acyltransferase
LRAGEAIRLPAGVPRGRAEGLHRIRTLLRQGGLVYLAGDGPFGREAFRIDLAGGPLVVRLGWLAMRRLTRVPTFPVFTYREQGRRVIVVHPPLPQPDADLDRDRSQCQAALTPLIETYVRRYPSQCRYLAFPAWEPDDSSGDAVGV